MCGVWQGKSCHVGMPAEAGWVGGVGPQENVGEEHTVLAR